MIVLCCMTLLVRRATNAAYGGPKPASNAEGWKKENLEDEMFTDNRHKGLAHYRAVKADRKEIAILAKEVARSNPDKTEAECRQLALEIREARRRAAEAKAKSEAERKKNHSGKGKFRPKGKGQKSREMKRRQADMSQVEVFTKGDA